MEEKKMTTSVNENMGKGKKKKLRLKKSVRRTIGSLMLATSIVVAAIPVSGVSADSPDTYKGNKTKAEELDDITVAATEVSALSVPSTGVSYGGFPLITDPADPYSPQEFMLGGKKFYRVNTDGYSSVQPIFILGKDGANPAQYLKKYIGDDVYVPPGGKVNLVSGYVSSKTEGSTDWEYQDPETHKFYLYRTTVIKYATDLYGEKLEVFGEAGIYHTVKFISEGDVLLTLTIEDGAKVADADIPDDPSSKTPGKVFKGWAPDPALQVITADTEFIATFIDAPSGASPADEEGENPEDSVIDDGTGDGTENPDENPEVTEDEGDNENPGEEPGTENPTENEPGSDTDSGNEDGDAVETEEQFIEVVPANAEPAGLTGIMLTIPGPPPSTREYEDTPIETYYVCDNVSTPYNPINYICDNAFENTKNVQHVQVPDKIFKIGNSAFANCTGLMDVTFGGGLQSVGVSAFQGCTGLGTVYYKNAMALSTIGAKAFAGSALSKLTHDPEESVAEHTWNNFTIPYSVTKIGDAAFYGTNMTTLDFLETNNCEVGNYAFAKCDSLASVDLTPLDTAKTNISNLSTPEGLFAECSSLKSAIMPTQFSGTLQPGTFGMCTSMEYIKFQSKGGTFSNGEFDNTKITVEGPKPENGSKYLNPVGNAVSAYTSSVYIDPDPAKDYNDYVYRYYDTDGSQHEIANVVAYLHDDDFFKTKEDTNKDRNKPFIFDVTEPTYVLTQYYHDDSATGRDLEIGNNIGQRGGGDIPILGIGDGVFAGNTSIKYLELNSTLNEVGKNSFSGTQIVRLWANVDGTAFKESAFANNSILERVTFAYDGEGGSSLGESCFAETPILNNVDFYDDNLETGDMTKYARFPAGTIASTAFKTNGRTEPVVFKGPMEEGYAPYEYAKSSTPNISNNLIYPKYYTGNPWNLTAQYVHESAHELNPVSGEEMKSGFYLLNYPNMTTKVDYDNVDAEDNYGSRTNQDIEDDAKAGTKISAMEGKCVEFARNIVVPYGIEFIDAARTKRMDYVSGGEKYLVFNDGDNTYHKDGLGYYNIFRYNPYLKSVLFKAGGVSVFPDRMFEGAQNLSSVEFAGDVKELGELPFYFPDTEAISPTSYKDSFVHEGPAGKKDYDKEFRSHLSSVVFSGESGPSGTEDNKFYTCTGGIIKGSYTKGSDNNTKVYQIAPSRGARVDLDDKNSAKFFGSDTIEASELSGVTEYADYAARDCDALIEVEFPADGCDISYGCFMDCDKLKLVTMPNHYMHVGEMAFAGITSPMDVTWPYTTYEIKDNSFEPMSDDHSAYPSVTFHVPEDSEYLPGYAKDHQDNIGYPVKILAKSITIRYLDANDDDYEQYI
ncbi:MAG: leucine-rich repeat protein [Lachnospiraceae bacterium]|nr:leucine-rich repeat protein [Lachnospiraceae bacterium]